MKIKKRIAKYLILFGVIFATEILAMQLGFLSWEGLFLITPIVALTLLVILLPHQIAVKRKHKYPAEVFLVSLIFYPLALLWSIKD